MTRAEALLAVSLAAVVCGCGARTGADGIRQDASASVVDAGVDPCPAYLTRAECLADEECTYLLSCTSEIEDGCYRREACSTDSSCAPGFRCGLHTVQPPSALPACQDLRICTAP